MRRQGARFTPGAPRRQRRTERRDCREKHDQGRDRDAKRLPHLAEVQSLALLGTVCVSAPVDSHFGRIDVDTAIEIHLTSNLLWRPRDPDHPEDVWLRRSRHAARPGTDEVAGDGPNDISHTYGYGVDDDIPIRAVYSSTMNRDGQQGQAAPGDSRSAEAVDFAPLGMGSRRFHP